MRVAVVAVLVFALCVSFALASSSQQEAERKLIMIQRLKDLLTEEEESLRVQLASDSESLTEMTHSEALARIQSAGIGISSSCGCSDRYNKCCTSLDGVNTKNIDGIITLKRASGCSITITGGTETGHASGTKSHWTGYKLDIALNSCINNYITNTFAYTGIRSDGAKLYTASSGNVYALEGNHWDILYP